jgi:hypothetical protein
LQSATRRSVTNEEIPYHTLTTFLRTFTAYLRYHTQISHVFNFYDYLLLLLYTVSRTKPFSRSKFNNAHFTNREYLKLENREMSMIMIMIYGKEIILIMVWDMNPHGLTNSQPNVNFLYSTMISTAILNRLRNLRDFYVSTYQQEANH